MLYCPAVWLGAMLQVQYVVKSKGFIVPDGSFLKNSNGQFPHELLV